MFRSCDNGDTAKVSKPKVSKNNLKSERVESSSNLSIFNMMGIEELQKRLVLSK